MGKPYTATNSGAVTQIGSGSLDLEFFCVDNNDSSKRYCQLFNAASGDVTLGTTAPYMSLPVLADGVTLIDKAVNFPVACSYAVTTTRSGSSAPSMAAGINAIY